MPWGSGDGFEHLITSLVEDWAAWESEYINQRQREGNPLRWYENYKLSDGAFATLLAIRIEPPDESSSSATRQRLPLDVGQWRAVAVGDSCVVHVRDSSIVTCFPLESPSDFHSSPALIGTQGNSSHPNRNQAMFISRTYKPLDEFFLMTDALAAWFIDVSKRATSKEFKQVMDKLKESLGEPSTGSFRTWITEQRSNGAMRNDDVAIVHIQL
ncbi:hypothetical protein AB0G06_34445 [Nonomuraea dietziae]|uniref:hypothetical protein n=1 Tax=Nonomuraea dietziae TaxID=65515 RepID=UPI0033F3B6F0